MGARTASEVSVSGLLRLSGWRLALRAGDFLLLQEQIGENVRLKKPS
jgi:hypothetical protein